ncbi:unnamed protein product [Linum tenue]|uniref:PPM-type phosphatase domain-containing protein n=1 Tax=Linum tenue TaxID=586396 RepID=A0AAV0QC33_9ROSI|nr:unnamed protein product [Linum tenue]
MCVQDAESVAQEAEMEEEEKMEKNDGGGGGGSSGGSDNRKQARPFRPAQMENWDKDSSFVAPGAGISVGESISEDRVSTERRTTNFVPALRSGEWSDIGGRSEMEDTYVCISDLAKKFGYDDLLTQETISLYGVNAGDCRAVLSRNGMAIELSMDHRPCSMIERLRVESLGGYVDDGYLNGQLSVTRALGDWHLEGMKDAGEKDGGGGPLIAEPELKLITLTHEDEFLIIGCDGIWEVFFSQNAVHFARRRLQQHNDVKQCCKEMVEEAIKRGATDNLTVVIVGFHSEPPPSTVVPKGRVRRSISAEGLQNLRCLLQG